jgi:hypothetical protein
MSVLNAISACSCGEFEKKLQEIGNDGQPLDLLTYLHLKRECKCVGPKSWSQLLDLTNLDRNTLNRAVKFLVQLEALIRNVERKKGHHVTYRTSEDCYALIEREYRPQELVKLIVKIGREVSAACDSFERFCDKHQPLITSLRQTHGIDGRDWSQVGFMALIRFVDRYGVHEGIEKLVAARKQFESTGFMAFERIVAVTGAIPTTEHVRRYADYLEKQAVVFDDL